MISKRKINSLWLTLLLPIGLVIVFLSKQNPNAVEKFYSNGLYQYVGSFLSIVTSIFPFSLGEAMVIFTIFFILISIGRIIIGVIKKSIGLKDIFLYSKKTIISFSIIYFVFNFLWGLNYYRLPFSKIANINTSPSTIIELESLCNHLIYKTNVLRNEIELDKNNRFFESNYKDIINDAYKGYEAAKSIYPDLGGSYGNPKSVLFSRAMSYMGITGIYFPFTGEANVNIDTPRISLPSTTTHEMAHQRGFAREDEANYIAYITCKLHPDLGFQYSGYILALTHSMNALYGSDKEKYIELNRKLSKNVKEDLTRINKYWERYEGPIERASTKMNNAYLKSNNQKDGVKSYGRMVDLLIAEYRMQIEE